MDQDMRLKSECMVSGWLSFIFRVSRVAGMGPIKFKKVRGGCTVRLSRFWHLYGHLVVIILLTMISCFTFQNRKGVVDGYDSATNTWFISVMKASLMIMRLVVGNVIVYHSFNRMRYFIDCTAKVDQINQELDRLFQPLPTGEIKMWFLVIFAMIHAYIAVSMEYGGFMNDMIAANDRIPISSCLFCGTFIYMLHLQTYPLQFFVVVTRLVKAQKRLNDCLRKLLRETRNQSSTYLGVKTCPEYKVFKNDIRLNMLGPVPNHSVTKVIDLLPVIAMNDSRNVNVMINVYCLMCDIVRQLNYSNGLSLMMFLLYICMYTVTAPYFVVAMLFRNQSESPAFRVLCIIAWCTLCFAMLALITEPCSRTHYQFFLTKRLVDQLMRFTTREAGAVYYELKLFRRHILLNPVSFSPMYFLTFDRSLLGGVLSTVITYLTVMINL